MPIVLSYTFNENSGYSFSPTVGTAQGTLSNDAKWIAGKNGSAIGLPAQGGASVIGAPILATDTWNSGTIMFDVLPFTDPGWGTRMPIMFQSASANWFRLDVPDNGISHVWLGTEHLTPTFTIPDGVWTNFAITWQGTSATIYVNGVSQGSVTITALPELTTILLTRTPFSGLGGAIDNLRIANEAFNQYDIAELATHPADWEPTPIQLDTPVLTVLAENDPSAWNATDGSIQISWPSVSQAHHYEAQIANGHNAETGFTTVSTNAVSPYTFQNLGGGNYTVGVIAHPE